MSRVLFALVAVIALAFGTAACFGNSAKAAVSPTDLVVGQIYEYADFKSCKLAGGSLATEWHFGGVNRSHRNQLTPQFDGRGRKIFRVVTNDRTLPTSHMRLRPVTEADPTLEGFSYGSYRWDGLVVEFNGRVEPQAVVRSCGTPRS